MAELDRVLKTLDRLKAPISDYFRVLAKKVDKVERLASQERSIDLSPLLGALKDLKGQLGSLQAPEKNRDVLTQMLESLRALPTQAPGVDLGPIIVELKILTEHLKKAPTQSFVGPGILPTKQDGATYQPSGSSTSPDVFMPSGGVFKDTATALTAGQGGTSRMTAYRAIHVNPRDSSGNEITPLQAGGDVNVAKWAGVPPTSKTLDSRTGIDIQQSSVASKLIIDFHSNSGGLAANAGKIFSPDGTRSTYYDTSGYGNLLVNFIDNSPGASPGTLYAHWSRDGVNTTYNDPDDGTGITAYDSVYSPTNGNPATGMLIPLGGRYVNFYYKNSTQPQGTTYPQLCEINLYFVPIGFTSSVNIANASVPVRGTGALADGQTPISVGGLDNITSPTTFTPLQVDTTGRAIVAGVATNFTNTPIVVAEKLGATGTESTVTVSNVSGTLLAASTTRRAIRVTNTSTTIPVYYRMSSSACTTASGGFTDIIPPGATVDIVTAAFPYSGAITCITASSTAAISITQITT